MVVVVSGEAMKNEKVKKKTAGCGEGDGDGDETWGRRDEDGTWDAVIMARRAEQSSVIVAIASLHFIINTPHHEKHKHMSSRSNVATASHLHPVVIPYRQCCRLRPCGIIEALREQPTCILRPPENE